MSNKFVDEYGNQWQPTGAVGLDGSLIIKPVPIESDQWRPKEGEQYWFIDNQSRAMCRFYNRLNEPARHHAELGNCFRTRPEAEAVADAARALFAVIHAHEDQEAQPVAALGAAVNEAHNAIYHADDEARQ